ncbi:large ribosomal subunit protein uL4-like [Musca autumnalis]|uniref:large ribosomal subunit protein uL4-like n=1 Tax=Musca autumnalis TaxID=221902 RepID=UPI003CF07A77
MMSSTNCPDTKSVSATNNKHNADSKQAGHQTSTESWQTRRAVACISRVLGGGINRSDQVVLETRALMVVSTKNFRRWNSKVNVSANLITSVTEFPLVKSCKNQEAVCFCRCLKIWTGIQKVY